MPGLDMTDVAAFFIMVGACLFFVVIWIMKADSKRNVFKDEIERLKTRLDAYGREKIMSPEASAGVPDTADKATGDISGKDSKGLQKNAILLMQSMKQIEELEKENKKLKAEAIEAKSSLEEVYKAIVEKK